MDRGDFSGCPEPPKPFVSVFEDGFGLISGAETTEVVRRYTFTNHNNLQIQVITYGATITSIRYPDKNGILEDVVLGYDDLEGYQSENNPYFGCIIGRVANRIAKGHFKIGENHFQLSTNAGPDHLHGGFKGFDKANWKSEIQDKKVVMTYLSKDEEEGYPGEVLVSVSFHMTPTNDFIIEMKATTSKPTPINLTNHSYFNLAGHDRGAAGLYEHLVSINSDRYCHTNENFIPSGMLKNVVNTFWDLRIARKLGTVLHHLPYGGYDQCMCIHKTTSECMTFVARVIHPESGRTLEIYSNQPAVQFYTSNKLPVKKTTLHSEQEGGMKTEPGADGCRMRRCPVCGQLIRDPDFENINDDEVPCPQDEIHLAESDQNLTLVGKDGVEYYRHAGLCLMTQNYPDAVHRKNFPNSIIRPGELYHHVVKYSFDLYNEVTMQLEEDDIIVDSEVEGEGEAEEYKEVDDLLDTNLEENGR